MDVEFEGEQIADGGEDLKLYKTFRDAKFIFDAYKKEWKEQGRIIDEEEFPYESFSINCKYLKNYVTVYTLRPVKLRTRWEE